MTKKSKRVCSVVRTILRFKMKAAIEPPPLIYISFRMNYLYSLKLKMKLTAIII